MLAIAVSALKRLPLFALVSLVVLAVPVVSACARSNPSARSDRPAPPSHLRATVGARGIVLTWRRSPAGANSIVGYRVYRNRRRIAVVTGTRHLDTRARTATTYRYYVVAYDASGHVSRRSNTVSARARTPVGSQPAPPGAPGDPVQGGVATPGNGLSADPGFFPIAVWDQTATSNAQNFAGIGVNTFVGQYNGNSAASLQALKNAGVIVISEQDSAGLNDTDKGVIKAWQALPDEPDNAQSNGSGGYGPCIAPSTIVSAYHRSKAADPTRPVYVNFGQGVANTSWVGRGSCTGDTAMYPQYAQGADIFSFDVYPVNEGYPLSIVATGVDNLRSWVGNKPVFAFVETTGFNGGPGPTPAQIRAETWLELIHGANGIEYFCHIFSPAFHEAGCLTLPSVVAQMKADDAEIGSLARELNSPTVTGGVTVASNLRVDTMVKSYGGSTYVFSEAVGTGGGSATFSVPRAGNGTVTVLGENRTLPLSGGSFTDSFAGYGVHLYQISAG